MAYETGEKIPSIIPESNGTPDNPIKASELRTVSTTTKLIFGDGTALQGGKAYAGEGSNSLWVWFPKNSGYSLSTVAVMMSNQDKTRRMESYLPGQSEPDIYEDYTVLNTIETESSGIFMVRMLKG